jgi:hypothetical protein
MGEVREDWEWAPGEEAYILARGILYAAREKLDKRIERDGLTDTGHMAKLKRDVERAQQSFDAAEAKFLHQPSVLGADGE